MPSTATTPARASRAWRTWAKTRPSPTPPPTARPTRKSRRTPSVRRDGLAAGDAADFGQRGLAQADLGEAVLAQRPHALLDGDRGDAVGRGALDHELPDLVAHGHDLEQADP